MWPSGRFDDAPSRLDRGSRPVWPQHPPPGGSGQSARSGRRTPPETVEGALDRRVEYWQSIGLHQGPVGRGQMLEKARSRNPDLELQAIASQQTGPSYDDTNLFKSEERIAAEQKRWQELLNGDFTKPQEKYEGERQDVMRAMFPYEHNDKPSEFKLKDDDFPPL